MLKMRCENLVENRKRIKNVLSASGPISAETAVTKERKTPLVAGSDIDNEFYERLLNLIHKEMSNPELNIDTLASKMGFGRSQLYRKVKALTNYSPLELLRKIRLNKARELLSTTDKPIGEIAYEVGFSAPAYFTRVFREMYGESPSDLRIRLGMKE